MRGSPRDISVWPDFLALGSNVHPHSTPAATMNLPRLSSSKPFRVVAAVSGLVCLVLALSEAISGLPFDPSLKMSSKKMMTERSGVHRFSIAQWVGEEDLRKRIHVRENGVSLKRVGELSDGHSLAAGEAYITRKNVWFTASDSSDPRTNGKRYDVTIRDINAWGSAASGLAGLALIAAGVGRTGARVVGAAMLAACRRFSRFRPWRALHGPEIPLSFAMTRIVVGITLWILNPIPPPAHELLASADPASYDPIGPFCLLCPASPSAMLIDICRAVFPVATLCLAAGFLTRISLLLTLFSLWTLASSFWIFGFICHGHTPFLLAALPLLAARCDALSVDRLLRRVLRLGSPTPVGTRAAVLGVQVMASLVFISAAMHKLYLGNGEFGRWIFSDSLRNLILAQYFVLRGEMAPGLQWAMQHEWVWRALAFGAVACQILPLCGISFVKRPWLRLMCGLAIVAEVRSLRLVMGIFPQPFMLLSLVFVDWEYFTRRLRRTEVGDAPAERAPIISPRLRTAFVVLLVSFQAIAGVSWFNVRWLYPFTGFPMFSHISARPPYDQHQPCTLLKSTWQIESTPSLSQAQLDSLWRNVHELPWNNASAPTRAANDVAAFIQTYFRGAQPVQVHAMNINAAIFQIEAHPKTAITLRKEAKFSETRGGATRAIASQLSWGSGSLNIHYTPEGFTPHSIELIVFSFADAHVQKLPGDFNPQGGSLGTKFVRDLSEACVKNEVAYLPITRSGGCWLLFVTRDAAGEEEYWSGPRLDP